MLIEKKIRAGKPFVWALPALGLDYDITLVSLASAAARMGEVGDLARNAANLGAGSPVEWQRKYTVELQINMDVNPVAGTVVELWWCPSDDGVTFTGGVTGADAAYTGTAGSTVAEAKIQLIHVGSIILTPNAETVIQRGTFIFSPPTRFGAPVVVNLGGQALEGVPTPPAVDIQRVTFTPLIEKDT